MLKRGPLIAVAIVIVALAATPYVIGQITENGFRDRIEHQNEGPVFTVSIASYDRGWFSSRVKLNYGLSERYATQLADLGIALPEDTLRSVALPVVVKIAHGPILLLNGFEIGSAAVKAQIDPDWQIVTYARAFLGLPYLIELRGRSGFGTGFTFEGEIPKASGAMGDFQYDFSGFEFTGRATRSATEFDADLHNFSLQSPIVSVMLDALNINADKTTRSDGIGLGSGGISLERLILSNPLLGATPTLSLAGLKIALTADEDADGESIDLSYSNSVDGLSVGSGLALTDAAVGLNFMHIDASAVTALRNASETANPADPAQLQALLQPIYTQLAKGSPTLSLDPFKFSMPEGTVEGHASLTIDGSKLPTGQASDLESTAGLLSALSAEAALKAPKALAARIGGMLLASSMPTSSPTGEPITPEQREALARAQTTQTLGLLSAQGLIVDDGDAYSCSIEFENGVATANGTPIPLGL